MSRNVHQHASYNFCTVRSFTAGHMAANHKSPGRDEPHVGKLTNMHLHSGRRKKAAKTAKRESCKNAANRLQCNIQILVDYICCDLNGNTHCPTTCASALQLEGAKDGDSQASSCSALSVQHTLTVQNCLELVE